MHEAPHHLRAALSPANLQTSDRYLQCSCVESRFMIRSFIPTCSSFFVKVSLLGLTAILCSNITGGGARLQLNVVSTQTQNIPNSGQHVRWRPPLIAASSKTLYVLSHQKPSTSPRQCDASEYASGFHWNKTRNQTPGSVFRMDHQPNRLTAFRCPTIHELGSSHIITVVLSIIKQTLN